MKRLLSFSLGVLFGVICFGVFQPNSSVTNNFHPKGFPFLKREGYCLQYDSRTKIPLWTQEHLDLQTLKKEVDRKGISFKEDPDIFPLHRSALEDFYKSGFDRGHMVPAADQSFSKKAMEDTFFLSNVCPQKADLNRGFWLHLERHIRNLVRKAGFKSVDVTTGPLFLPKIEVDGKKFVTYQVIGKNNVAVPTHFFKFVVGEKEGKTEKWAYVVPNINLPKNKDFEEYRVPIPQLEKISGLVLPCH